MRVHGAAAGVGDQDRPGRRREGLKARGLVGMAEVDGDAEAVHPRDRFAAQRRQAVIVLHQGPGAERRAQIVAEAHHPDAAAPEVVDPLKPPLVHAGRLEGVDDPEAPVALGGLDVAGLDHLADHPRVLGDGQVQVVHLLGRLGEASAGAPQGLLHHREPGAADLLHGRPVQHRGAVQHGGHEVAVDDDGVAVDPLRARRGGHRGPGRQQGGGGQRQHVASVQALGHDCGSREAMATSRRRRWRLLPCPPARGQLKLGKAGGRPQPKRTPVRSSETDHSRRAAASSCAGFATRAGTGGPFSSIMSLGP